jgi:hypothetical protein
LRGWSRLVSGVNKVSPDLQEARPEYTPDIAWTGRLVLLALFLQLVIGGFGWVLA